MVKRPLCSGAKGRRFESCQAYQSKFCKGLHCPSISTTPCGAFAAQAKGRSFMGARCNFSLARGRSTRTVLPREYFSVWVTALRCVTGEVDAYPLARRFARGVRRGKISARLEDRVPVRDDSGCSLAENCQGTPTKRESLSSVAMRDESGEIVVRGNLEPSTFSASRIAVRRRGEAGPHPPPDDAPEVAGQAEGGEHRTPATRALARPGAKMPCARSSWATPATAVCPWMVRPRGAFRKAVGRLSWGVLSRRSQGLARNSLLTLPGVALSRYYSSLRNAPS